MYIFRMLDKMLESPEIIEEKKKQVEKEKSPQVDEKKTTSKKSYPSKNYDGTKKYDKPYEKPFQQNTKKENNRCYALFPLEGDLFKAMFNNEQVQFRLSGINLEGKTSSLAKKSYYFLNETIKKKNLYLKFEGKDAQGNAIVEAFFEPELTTSLNKMMLDKGLVNENSSPESKQQTKIAKPVQHHSIEQEEPQTPSEPAQQQQNKKRDNCYVLWPVTGNKLVAMHKNVRKEFILDNINLSNKNDPVSINAVKYLEQNFKKKVVYVEFKGKDASGTDIVEAFTSQYTNTSINSTMIEHGLFKKPSSAPAASLDTSFNDNVPDYMDQGLDSNYDDMYMDYANQEQQNAFQHPVDDFFDNTPLAQLEQTNVSDDHGFDQPGDDFFDSMPVDQMQAPSIDEVAPTVAPRKLKFPK